MRFSLLVSGLIFVAFIAGCESKEDVAIAKAEKCLNTATSTTAMDCVSGLSSYTNEKAYLLRCSALYLKNGFTGTRLLEAFKNLKNSGGTDPMAIVMSTLAFSTIAEANEAGTYCSMSGSVSLERLSDMTKMATIIPITMGIIPSSGLTEGQMLTAIQNMRDGIQGGTLTADQLAALPGLATTISESASNYCYEGSSYSSNVVCTNLNTAIQSGGSNSDLVKSLLDQLLVN